MDHRVVRIAEWRRQRLQSGSQPSGRPRCAGPSDYRRRARGRRGVAAGLHIGTFPAIAASLLPRVVRAFRTRYPQVELAVRSDRNAGLMDLRVSSRAW
ncbi:LysR family transcriptional regulator substrate-binding protein [Streptomyces sp. NPDC002144]